MFTPQDKLERAIMSHYVSLVERKVAGSSLFYIGRYGYCFDMDNRDYICILLCS